MTAAAIYAMSVVSGSLALVCWPLRAYRPQLPQASADRSGQLIARLRRRQGSEPSRAAFATLVQSIAPALAAGVPSAVAVATAASVAARNVSDDTLRPSCGNCPRLRLREHRWPPRGPSSRRDTRRLSWSPSQGPGRCRTGSGAA